MSLTLEEFERLHRLVSRKIRSYKEPLSKERKRRQAVYQSILQKLVYIEVDPKEFEDLSAEEIYKRLKAARDLKGIWAKESMGSSNRQDT